MAVRMDVDVAAGVESRKYAPMSNGSARSAVLGTVESYGMQTLCECREQRRGYPAVVHSGKIAVLEKTLVGMGDDEPILAGKRVLEKELEKLQKKLNGPKKTAQHIEAKQNWINRESKRLRGRNCKTGGIAREPQSSKRNIESGLRGNQDSQRTPSERGRNDGQKQEPLLVSGGHGGNLEASNSKNWRSGEGRLRRDWLGGLEMVQRRKSLVGRWRPRDSTKKSKQRRENCKRRS